MLRLLFLILVFLPFPLLAQLQFHYQIGGTASFMAQTGPIVQNGLFFGYHQGLGLTVWPRSDSPLQLGMQLQYSFQGYRQQKAAEEYRYHMHYFNVPVWASYPLLKGVRIEGGAYVASLIRARFLHADDNIGVAENYRNVDTGLLAGLHLLDDRTVGIYVRYQASLLPALVYPEIAPSGEFTGELRLLRPQLLMAGIRVHFNKHSIRK